MSTKKQEPKKTTTKPNTGTAKKTTSKKTQKDLGLVPNKTYSFVSNGKGPGMDQDKTFKVSGQVAQILFDKGYGQIK